MNDSECFLVDIGASSQVKGYECFLGDWVPLLPSSAEELPGTVVITFTIIHPTQIYTAITFTAIT